MQDDNDPPIVQQDNPPPVQTDPPAPAPQADPPPPVTTPEPVKPQAQDWKEKRISQLTARLREAEAKLATATTQTPPANPGTETPEQRQAAVQAEANRIAAANEFNRQCDETARLGRTTFPDFDAKIAEFGKLGTSNDPLFMGAYQTMIAAAIETGQAPALLHSLGSDLNEAARILALSPVRMGVELAKLAGKIEAKGKAPPATEADLDPDAPSTAPRPIVPVGQRASAHTAIDPTDPTRADSLSTAEWMKRRNAQMRKAG